MEIEIPKATYIQNDLHWNKNRCHGVTTKERHCKTYVGKRRATRGQTFTPKMQLQSRTIASEVARSPAGVAGVSRSSEKDADTNVGAGPAESAVTAKKSG